MGVSIVPNSKESNTDQQDSSVNKANNKLGLSGLGYGKIDPIHKTSITKSAITDQAGLSHINTGNLSSKDSQQALNPIISNDFTNQKSPLEKELGGQTTITAAFDGERRRLRSEYAKEAEDRREEAKNLPDGDPNKLRLEAEAQKIERNIRLFDGLASALYTPNTGGAVGDVARAVSPHMAYQIEQYFKSNDYKNTQDNQNRPGEQSLQHLMAHAILGAATSYATGQDIGIGALSAVSSETAAPAISKFLFGKDSKELTQDEKDTITNIITLATASTAYTITDGDVAGSVSAAEVGRVGVGNNYFTPIRNEKSINILDLNIKGDEKLVVYALAEYMVEQGMLSLDDVPSSVYSDMVDGGDIIDVNTGEIIKKNPTEEDYRNDFKASRIITHEEFQELIKKHPNAYNSLIEKISKKERLDNIKTLGLQVLGGASGVAVSFGQMGEPILHPIETAGALYQFATTEDKLLAIQLAVAMDLQNRQELLELHHKNNDTFGIALETSKNTADALLVLSSIYKAPKEIATLIPTLKQAGTIVFNGVRYTVEQGKIVAQRIPNHAVSDIDVGKVEGINYKEIPSINSSTNADANIQVGDWDLPNVYDRQNQQIARVGYTEKSIFNKYSEKTEIKIVDIDEQAEFLSQAVNGLPKEQAKIILETAKSSNTSVVFGGSRVRGDFHDGSDVDIGFGHVNANKAGKMIKKINDKSQNINGYLNPESTRIVPNNETANISKIESPEEFFQRSGIRADKDKKSGQPYTPSGSITVNTDGTITITPPKKLKCNEFIDVYCKP